MRNIDTPALRCASTSTHVPAPSPARTIPFHDAKALVGSAGEARIVLGEAVYTLRITRQGKLILTK